MMPIALVFATVALIAAGSAAEEKFRKLSGAQIRAAFSGMELSDEVHWYELFEKSGTLFSSSMGRKRTGKWWVEKDQLCVEFENDLETCYEERLSGKKDEVRSQGVLKT